MDIIALFVALALAGPIQERSAPKLPQKGDAIVVKGCLRGSALESTETGLADSDTRSMTSFVYRLTGDKATLKKLREEHDGKVVEVSGVLKSTLPAGDAGVKTFGNSRVRIGIGNPAVGSPAAEAARSIPVLQVKDYEGVPVKCGG